MNGTNPGKGLDIAEINSETWTLIRQHPLYHRLSDDELKSILPFFNQVNLRANEFPIEEGNSSIDLYIVLKGNLDVIKSVGRVEEPEPWIDKKEFTIANLTVGDIMGELSFIRGVSRSASIRSTTDSSLLSLSPANLSKLEAEFPKSFGLIMKNMLGYTAENLRKTSANEVNALKIELQNSALNAKANLFFSYIIGLLCIYNLAIQTITNLSMDTDRASIVSAAIIGIFSAGLVFMILQSKLPIWLFGLTTKNWKPAVAESLIWTAVVIAALVVIKWILIHSVQKYSGLELFNFDVRGKKYLIFNFALYGLHSPIQEFIARGVLQGSLSHFLKGRYVTLRAILLSNALFSATHVHLLGGLLGVIVFVPGLLWGWLYSRHPNLIGVSLSHILIGWTALFFLDLASLL